MSATTCTAFASFYGGETLMGTAEMLGQTRSHPELPSEQGATVDMRTVPHRRAALVLLWAIAVGYLALMIDRQWVADDEGLLAQAAERVLRGEAPHRDFGDMYTGGQAYLHAFALHVGGISLLALRYTLLLATAAWIPVVYAVARRLTSSLAAIPLTALAIVWSVPNYAAAMPSWYNLFLATLGLGALIRFIDTGRPRWLVTAGLAGGLSFLVKVTGLYYIAGVLLFLLVRAARTQAPFPETAATRAWLLTSWVSLGGFVLALVGLIAPIASVEHAFHFVLPSAALAIVAGAELRRRGGLAPRTVMLLLRWVLCFVAGVLAPIALFALPYVAAGDVSILTNAWFLAPTTRYQSAAFAPLPLPVAVPALLVLLLAAAFISGRRRAVRVAAGVAIVLPIFLWVIAGTTWYYRILWLGMAQSTPLVVLAGAAYLLVSRDEGLRGGSEWDGLFLVLALAGLCSLVQIPFAAPIYFCYTAPLTLLAAGGLWRALGARGSRGMGSLALGYTLFAIVWLNGHGVDELGLKPPASERLVQLPQARAGLRVPVLDERIYTALVDTLQRHARGGYTFAAPEAPEVYYLTGLRNPTRVLFEFTEHYQHSPDATLRLLERHRVTAIAINRDPKFSPPLSPELLALLARAYPDSVPLGKFLVRWTE